MHDDIVRILSPLLIVAAMAAMQMARPDMGVSDVAGDWAQPAVTSSCHGTRLGNNLGSACVAPLTQP
jgi:hypothetical protein